MNVLRLTHSDDTHGDIPAGGRSWEIVERALGDASGEAVSTTIRAIWPTADLASHAVRWLDHYQPEVVTLWISNYWHTYESVPIGLERRFGRIAKPLARAGVRLGGQPWLNQRPVYGRARGLLLRAVGGRTHFSCAEVIERLEECIRTVLQHEDVALLVRASLFPMVGGGNARQRARGEERRVEVNRAIQVLCETLHVPFIDAPDGLAFLADRANFQADGYHLSAPIHTKMGAEEGRLAVEAWRQLGRDSHRS